MRTLNLALFPLLTALPALAAQSAPQPSKPPVAEVWIDLATTSSNMPGMPAMGGGLLGALLGAKGGGGNVFGNTRMSMSPGRWMDVTLMTRNQPDLRDALQQVPEGSKLAPTLKLVSPEGAPVVHTEARDEEVEPAQEPQRPKGKILLYWGCSATVRKGQPKVLDMATAAPTDFGKFFQSRRATTRGAHATPGQPAWPNKQDSRLIPEGASLVGEHVFTGDGVPEGFKLTLDAAHDLMPAIALQQRDDGEATVFRWQALDQARAYFLASMSTNGDHDMVVWTSSELPDAGFGLLDYQPNAAIDRWLKDKVLLGPKVTECAAPKEALGVGMTRMIAYGDELNVAYPPRPKDPKQVWAPQWAAKVRLKSVAMSIGGAGTMGRNPDGGKPGTEQNAPDKPKLPGAVDVLKGLFGR
jgi:hypothetical protein